MKTWLITGCSSGIGAGIAKAVLESGANAVITAQPKENALTVPLSAIAMRDDQRTVYVIEDGVAVRRVLTTGYIGDNVVEVLDGITEKDHIITGGLNKVREGAKVRVSASAEEGAA